MNYRKIGHSDVSLTEITFGAWAIGGWMWGGADRQEAIKAIHSALDQGITSIDTAPIYGQGTSEEIIAEALKGVKRDEVQIATKCGMRWDLTKGDFAMKSKDNNGREIDIYKYAGKESVIEECENSLRRLKTDYIDLYQLHWPDVTTPIAETMEAMDKLLQQGKIRAAGVCNYSFDQLQEAEKTIRLASAQEPYSMVKRGIEKKIVPWCKENDKAILAYSPLQRGLLTGKFSPDHEFNEGDTRKGVKYFTPENIQRVNGLLKEIEPIAKDKNATLAQLVIRWTLEQPGITIALVGARNPKQVLENARAADIKLNAEELDAINEAIDKLTLAEVAA